MDGVSDGIGDDMSEWISVKDRLPDVPKDDYMSDYVLAYDKNAGIWVAFFCSSGYWCEARECVSFENVTHWMPLPEPPTEV